MLEYLKNAVFPKISYYSYFEHLLQTNSILLVFVTCYAVGIDCNKYVISEVEGLLY